jgi:hypothetical protein
MVSDPKSEGKGCNQDFSKERADTPPHGKYRPLYRKSPGKSRAKSGLGLELTTPILRVVSVRGNNRARIGLIGLGSAICAGACGHLCGPIGVCHWGRTGKVGFVWVVAIPGTRNWVTGSVAGEKVRSQATEDSLIGGIIATASSQNGGRNGCGQNGQQQCNCKSADHGCLGIRCYKLPALRIL